MPLIEDIRNEMISAAKTVYGIDINPHTLRIEPAPENTHGTHGANIGFLAGKPLKINPYEAASKISAALSGSSIIKNIKPIKPGYVNFYINPSYYRMQTVAILNDKNFFKNNYGEGKKVNIEYVSANPVGPLNIVSGRAASYGTSLAAVMEYSGYDVTKEFYVNDAGRQMDLFGLSLKERYFELCDLGYEAKIPEDGYKGEYVKELAKTLLEEKGDYLYKEYKSKDFDLKNNFFREYGLNKMVEWQKRTLEKFNVKFDSWFMESELYKSGEVKEALLKIEKNGYLKYEEGATWFKTTIFGDDKDRVIIKQDGSYTYFASDIAYMNNKLIKRGFDMAINILGPDHHGYIKRMEAIVRGMGFDEKEASEKYKVLILQQVNLLESGEKVKMSKRAGKIVTLDELIDEVGADAARYFYVMRNYNTHLDFDIDLATEQSDKNPVYYVQYAYARARGIFDKALSEGYKMPDFIPDNAFENLEPEEESLILRMIALPEAIKESAIRFTPNYIVPELFNLVSAFHSFYNKHKVVSADMDLTSRRLYILAAFRKSLLVCFEILGITARERM